VPRYGRSILEGIPEGAVGVRHSANSAVIANGGVKSHCGTTCFQHENIFLGDVITKFLLAIRTVCSGCCARFPDDETCYFELSYQPTILPVFHPLKDALRFKF
jgi:hypothetical protein